MESGQQRSCVRFRDLAVQYLLIVIQMLTSSIKIQVTVMRNWSVPWVIYPFQIMVERKTDMRF